ncbi:hypothetical protein D3C71_1529980 [compost metagenome]
MRHDGLGNADTLVNHADARHIALALQAQRDSRISLRVLDRVVQQVHHGALQHAIVARHPQLFATLSDLHIDAFSFGQQHCLIGRFLAHVQQRHRQEIGLVQAFGARQMHEVLGDGQAVLSQLAHRFRKSFLLGIVAFRALLFHHHQDRRQRAAQVMHHLQHHFVIAGAVGFGALRGELRRRCSVAGQDTFATSVAGRHAPPDHADVRQRKTHYRRHHRRPTARRDHDKCRQQPKADQPGQGAKAHF